MQWIKNPEKIEKFLRACRKGFDFMKENPEEALQILLDHQNEENFPLSKTVETKSMEILLPVMETEDAKFLSQDVSVWQNNADWMYEKWDSEGKDGCFLPGKKFIG